MDMTHKLPMQGGQGKTSVGGKLSSETNIDPAQSSSTGLSTLRYLSPL